MRVIVIALLAVIFLVNPLIGQEKDSSRYKNTILPIAFVLPETGLGVGVTGILQRKPESPTDTITRVSSLLYSAAYTFKNQLLIFLPFEAYTRHNNVRVKGELGYYRYFYNFYGVGDIAENAELEIYEVNFPRIDVNYSRRVTGPLYLGLGYQYDFFDIQSVEPDGLLDRIRPIGVEGGSKSNIYLLSFYDTRDNYFSSNKGFYAQAVFKRDFLFSDYDFNFFELDVRKFFSWKSLVSASRVVYSTTSKGTPFFDLPYIASPNRARGFNDRRFIDYNVITLQEEIRYPIYKRLSGTVFGSANLLSGEFDDIFNSDIRWSYGAGLRFILDKQSGARLRLDIARSGNGETNLYITTNEAF